MIQIPTPLQKVDMALSESAGVESNLAAYKRPSLMRNWARCLVALGFSSVLKSDNLRTFVHAPFARCSLLVKC
jgi:hypothetical protein